MHSPPWTGNPSRTSVTHGEQLFGILTIPTSSQLLRRGKLKLQVIAFDLAITSSTSRSRFGGVLQYRRLVSTVLHEVVIARTRVRVVVVEPQDCAHLVLLQSRHKASTRSAGRELAGRSSESDTSGGDSEHVDDDGDGTSSRLGITLIRSGVFI